MFIKTYNFGFGSIYWNIQEQFYFKVMPSKGVMTLGLGLDHNTSNKLSLNVPTDIFKPCTKCIGRTL